MEDRLLLATFLVTDALDDNNLGSLRFAINQSNLTAGPNTINFAIPGTGVRTIPLTAALPTITQPVTIDGTSESVTSGASGTPQIELNGANAGATADGLALAANGSTVIGLAINRFSGNGISIKAQAGGTIQGNVIGLDPTGTIAEGNGGDGIVVFDSTSILIGGTAAGTRNLISANSGNGINAVGATSGLQVVGNSIGTDVSGTLMLGNKSNGIRLFASNNTVGGPTANAGNTIAFNGVGTTGAGVLVVGNSSSDAILSNLIYQNAGRGIDLGGSGNNLQSFPVLTTSSSDATSTTILGSFSGAASTTYTLQFFDDNPASVDPSGFGQGRILLGSTPVTTDASGNAAIKITFPVAVPVGDSITATATDPSGNTSQFAKNIVNVGTADLSVAIGADKAMVASGDTLTYTITVTNKGPTDARTVKVIDTLPQGVTFLPNQSSTTQGIILTGAGQVTVDVGTMRFGGPNVTIMLAVQVNAGAPSPLQDSVTVGSAESDPILGNNTMAVSTPVVVAANLGVSVQGSAATVQAGQSVTYTVTAVNQGPNDATNVVLTDVLPANVTVVSVTSTQGTPSPTLVNGMPAYQVTVPTLTGVTGTITLTLTVNTTGMTPASAQDTATINSPVFDPDTTNNTASATTTVTPVTNLGIAVTPTPSPLPFGQDLTYQVVVTNNGPSQATALSLTDILPAGVAFKSGSDSLGGSATFTNGTVTDTIGALASGQSATVTIVVTPTDNQATAVSNTFNLTDAQGGSASQSVNTVIQPIANVSVQFVMPPATVQAGQTITYTILVTNNGPSGATGLVLTDTLPVGVTFKSAADTQSTAIGQSGQTVTDPIGTLAAGASVTVTIVGTVTGATAPSIVDTATVTASDLDPKGANTLATATTTVTPAAHLIVTISPPPTPALITQNLPFAITLLNAGPSPATQVSLTGNVPAGTIFLSAGDGTNTFQPISGQVVDNLATLAPGASVTLTIIVQPTSAGPITETAQGKAQQTDPDPRNETATATVTVQSVADLVVTASADQNSLVQGNPLTYKATVTNRGPSAAQGFVLNDTLPAGVTFVSATDGTKVLSPSNGQIVENLASLDPGASVTLTVVVIPPAAGTITNTFNASSSSFDPTPQNNTAAVQTNVVQPPGTIQFAVPALTVSENAGNATITVSRTNGSQGTVTVHYSTGGGTATPGVDYVPTQGTLVFVPGQTTQTITIPVLANPTDNRDKLVNIQLDTPGSGAVLGAQTTAQLTIHDIDPDLTFPTVSDVQLFGVGESIAAITLAFSKALDPASANNPASYQLFDAGPDGRIGTFDDLSIGVAQAVYDPGSHTVTLFPAAPLAPNEFYWVNVLGVTDPAGNLVSGAGNATAGGSASFYVARGTFLSYPDNQGHLVTLQLSGGGLLDLTRHADGEGGTLQLLGAIPGSSVLSGTVQGGSTRLDTITGLGSFGQVRVQLATPPFYVSQLPFNNQLIGPASFDIATFKRTKGKHPKGPKVGHHKFTHVNKHRAQHSG